ncbi:MAG: EamA family transporter, partial [Aeromonas veronii]
GSMLVMVNGELQLQQAYLPGYLLALGAAVVWGAYSVLSRRLPPAPAVVTAAACLPAGLLALLLARLLEGPLPLAQIPTSDWWLIIGLALGPMGAAFVTWYLALRDGDPRRIGALAYLTPLLSTLLLVALNGEELTSRHLLAGALIMGGALLGMLGQRNSALASPAS